MSAGGELHVVPVGFRYNPERDAIDIGGRDIVPTLKYRQALRHGRAAFVVDDVLPPWKPRYIEVRGTVEGVPEGGREIVAHFSPAILRLTPDPDRLDGDREGGRRDARRGVPQPGRELSALT